MRFEPIKRFEGPFRFLSNFSDVLLSYNGEFYDSVEHAYQAQKTWKLTERKPFTSKGLYSWSAAKAKRKGRKLVLRDDWEHVKQSIMLDLLRKKFQHVGYRASLKATSPCQLEEGNNHGDTYWGTVDGVGENHLGKLLMQVRHEILVED